MPSDNYTHKKHIIARAVSFLAKYYFTFLLTGVLLYLFTQAFIRDNVVQEIERLQSEIIKQENINLQQELANKTLDLKINALKNTKTQVLESEARYKLGFIKLGETYYQIE